MELQQLATLKKIETKGQSSLQNTRQQEFQKYLEKGMASLKEAHQQDFKNPELLKESFSQFQEAIKRNRSQPEPYLGAIYVLLLIGNMELAQIFLSALQAQHPDNSDAKKMQRYITNKRKTKPSASPIFVATTTKNDELDLDALYDQVEESILEKVQTLSTIPPPMPSFEKNVLVSIQGTYKELKTYCQQLTESMAIIDEEIDTSDLKRDFRALESYLRRFKEALTVSKEFNQLDQQIKENLDLIEEISQEAQKTNDEEDIPVLEENLEVLLDHCDEFADKIDIFSKKGYTVALLEKSYEKLVEALEDFQDIVDDAIEKIKQSMG